jgi:hypothetical protein
VLSLRFGQRRKGKRKGPYHRWRAFEIRVLLAHDTSRHLTTRLGGRGCGGRGNLWQVHGADSSFRSSGLASGYVSLLAKAVDRSRAAAWVRSGRGGCEDRSSRSAWECRQGRSAFRFWKVTRGAVEIVPHAPRGNAARDAPRSASGG